MKTKFKTSSRSINHTIFKNSNFINNQNYILGKNEKKKILSKFFIERFIKIKNKFKLYNNVKFKNDFTLEKFINNNLHSGGTTLTLKSFFYTIFIIILPIPFLYYFIGINLFLIYPALYFSFYLLIVGIMVYINIISLFYYLLFFIGSLILIIYFLLNYYFINTKGFIFIKNIPKAGFLYKFTNINENYAKNKYYKIIKK